MTDPMAGESATQSPRVTPSLTESTRSGPGRMIREARERAHLSLEELAARTRLARATLDALERDDFTVLSDAVYVRGYYRKCGKALGLSEPELLERYESLAGPARLSAPTKLLLAGGAAPVRARGVPAWVWLAAVALGVLIAAFAVWRVGRGVPVKLSAVTSVVVPAAVPAAPAPEAAPPPPAPSAPTAAAPQPVPAQVNASPTVAPPSPSANISPADEHAAAAPPPAAAPAPAPVAAAPAAPAPAPSVDNDLALNFAGTSYVRVQDATGRTLLNSKVKAGDNQVLTGHPPYRIFVGNAGVVEVHFHGSAVDLKPFVGKNHSASLRVPES